MNSSRLYIAVLDEFPDYMVPTLVAHTVLGAHLKFQDEVHYNNWLNTSFKKVTVRVNQKEFDKIAALDNVHLAYEKHTLERRMACAIVCPMPNEKLPNVLKFAKLWEPTPFKERLKDDKNHTN